MIKRRKVQIVIGILIYFLVSAFQIPIGYVIIFGGLLGIIFGKVFCRWMCPIGIFMEWLMKRKGTNGPALLRWVHTLFLRHQVTMIGPLNLLRKQRSENET